jgi:hypothetical protein
VFLNEPDGSSILLGDFLQLNLFGRLLYDQFLALANADSAKCWRTRLYGYLWVDEFAITLSPGAGANDMRGEVLILRYLVLDVGDGALSSISAVLVYVQIVKDRFHCLQNVVDLFEIDIAVEFLPEGVGLSVCC